jgi:hypothetical protein
MMCLGLAAGGTESPLPADCGANFIRARMASFVASSPADWIAGFLISGKIDMRILQTKKGTASIWQSPVWQDST